MANEFTILQNEVLNDPLGRGYSGMSDAQVVADMLVKNRDNWVTLSSSQVFEATVPSEFQALTSAEQERIDRIYGLGDSIESEPGSNARSELVSVFGSTSDTISNLANIANQQISRAAELGIAGYITEGRVNQVRS